MALNTWSEEDLVELEFVRAKEIDAFVDQAILPETQRYNNDLHNGFTFEYPEFVLQITTGKHYPVEPPSFEVINSTLPRVVIDGLREELRQVILDDRMPGIFNEWNHRAECDSLGSVDFPLTALRLVTATIARLQDFRAEAKYWRNFSGLPPSLLSSFAPNLDNDTGSKDSILDLLGKTPEHICSLVPSEFKILHIEKVVRRDLTRDFHSQALRIRDQLNHFSVSHLRKNIPVKHRFHLKSKEAIIDHLLQPHLTFHGTQRHIIPSIVRNGFLLPGDLNPLSNTEHGVRCGNTYGRGIYSSPSADFALSYSGNDATVTDVSKYDGLKLIVCATTMGVAAHVSRGNNFRGRDQPVEGATSHVGFSEMEYIVFNRAQILPCYVIHLDWGHAHEGFFRKLPANPWAWLAQHKSSRTHPKLSTEVLSPGDKQRLKEARVAKAAKYLGYGFGPASGAALVIEEVGEVSEDEEDYGEFQKDRVVGNENGWEDGEKGFWEWQEEEELEDLGVVEGNEYTEARKAKSLLDRIKQAEKVRKAEEARKRLKAEALS
ncbi:MAG: hypothetical protein Q9195_002224 [Heterodermia aff. obscurata]